MKFNHKTNKAARGGLTLIELVVVLVILVALAGLLLPLFPSMIDRAHTSTTASNITEVAKSIQLFEAMNLRSPDGFDSLINESGETLRDDRFTVVTLDTTSGGSLTRGGRIRDALRRVGITTSFTMRNPEPDAIPSWAGSRTMRFINTFEPYSGGVEDLRTDGRVVVLGPELNEITRLGLPLPSFEVGVGEIQDYVAFGVGANTTMIAETMGEAPVHFPGTGDLDPSRTYSRFAVIYAIPRSGAARFAAVAAIHGDHFDSLSDLQEDYYELSRSPLNFNADPEPDPEP